MYRRCYVVLLLVGSPFATLAQASAVADIEVVSRLYREFAWEAVIDEPKKGAASFINQSRRGLERYLEPKLAALLLADRTCVSRTKEICRLNFDPIWDSQDPGATELKIKLGAKKGTVDVTFVYPSNGQRIQLQYDIAATTTGPRIFDIRYKRGASLRSILQGEP